MAHSSNLGNLADSRRSNHDGYFCNVAVKVMLLMVIVVTIVILIQPSNITLLIQQNSYKKLFSWRIDEGNLPSPVAACDPIPANAPHDVVAPPPYQGEEENKLQSILKNAAMADGKTVIITTLNAAWAAPNSMFDLFLDSFRIGNQTQHFLKHLIVVTFDQTAFSRCSATNLICFPITTAGVNFTAEKVYMTDDYIKMMWRRIDFLRIVLQLGFDFVFTDADVMWLRNPFDRFYSDGEIQIACDYYRFGPTDPNNPVNGGFNYVKSSNQTIEFFKYWYRGRNYFPGKHDQDVFNVIKFNPMIKELGLQVRFLDTIYFSGFCEPSKDLNLVVTVHANCRIGLKGKTNALKTAMNEWKRYIAAVKVAPSPLPSQLRG